MKKMTMGLMFLFALLLGAQSHAEICGNAEFVPSATYQGELRTMMGFHYHVTTIFYCDIIKDEPKGLYLFSGEVEENDGGPNVLRGIIYNFSYDKDTRTLTATVHNGGAAGTANFVFSEDFSTFSGTTLGLSWSGKRF